MTVFVNGTEPLPTYTGWASLEKLLRKWGHPVGQANHVLQLEAVSAMVEADLMRFAPDGLRPEWVLVERHITDDRRVGRITRVIHTDLYTSHFELHLLARSWMMCQQYPIDFGPGHCETCPVSTGDEAWLRETYLKLWAERIGR